jgi:cellulose synthase/poly-beta-1,6-N-acetylglucosamine synthase-like glycosyltransferase
LASPTVTTIVTVLRSSQYLRGILDNLMDDPYKDKEVIVVVDEPTEEMKELSTGYPQIKFLFNAKRIGKVNAINQGLKEAHGEFLLFLDSDLVLENGNIITIVAEKMGGNDILDFKKDIIHSSIISRMVSFDYLGANISAYMFSNFLKKTIALDGAAFAIRRESFERIGGFRKVISEDFDLGTRAYLSNLKYKLVDEMRIKVKAPDALKAWYEQRKRWGIGTGYWLKSNARTIFKVVYREPQVVLPSLFFIMPSILLMSLNYFFPKDIYLSLTAFALLIFASYFTLELRPIFLVLIGVSATWWLLMAAITFLIVSAIYYAMARKLGLKFNVADFLLYYFAYSPISLSMFVLGFILAISGYKTSKLDWLV